MTRVADFRRESNAGISPGFASFWNDFHIAARPLRAAWVEGAAPMRLGTIVFRVSSYWGTGPLRRHGGSLISA